MPFPTSILSLASAIGSQFLSVFHGGTVSHSDGTNQMLTDLIAVETKLGTGASTATANTVLRGTGSGTTAFGQIVSADITDGTIVNADVNASAAIAVSKLAAMTNKTLLTSNGTTNAESASPTVSGTFTAETGLTVNSLSLTPALSTWTPSVGGTATYTTQTGLYFKVGRMVTVWCTLTINALGTGSNSTVFGLPFAADADGGGAVLSFSGLASNAVFLSVLIPSGGSSSAQLQGMAAAGAATAAFAGLANGTSIRFVATYRAAS